MMTLRTTEKNNSMPILHSTLKLRNNAWYILLLAAFTFIAFFYGIGAYPIIDMNEGLYSELGREMLLNPDYLIIPHLNFVPYIEKPPLLYWLIALSYKCFGVNTYAARLIPALSSTSITIILYWFAKKLNIAKIGWVCGIILASSVGYILIARVVFFDMLLNAWLTLALCNFFLWYQFAKKKFLYLAYFATGLAVMTKGILPLALAFLIALTFMFCMRTTWQKFLSFFNPLAIAIFLGVVLPWHILAALRLPNFFHDFVINEQILRFFNARIPHDYHTGPIYYYIPRIFVYLFPWILLLPLHFRRMSSKPLQQKQLHLFMWIWFLLMFVVFSLSSGKGDYYMGLGMPPLAFLLASKITADIKNNQQILLGLFCLAATLIIGLCYYMQIKLLIPLPSLPQLQLLIIYLIVYSSFALLLAILAQNSWLNLLLIAGLIAPMVIEYVSFEVKQQDFYNQQTLHDYVQQHHPERQLFLFREYEKISSLLFQQKRRLPIIDSWSQDLIYGANTPAAQGWFISNEEFLAQIISGNKNRKSELVYVATLPEHLDFFQKTFASVNFCIVAKSVKAVLLSNDKKECFKARP